MESIGDYLYNTKEILGSGAFSSVYKAHHKTDSSKIAAVKCITKNKKMIRHIHNEIGVLMKLTALKHQHVVALYDWTETTGTLSKVYLVMEYCNGGDLAEYMAANGKLDEDTIRFFLQQLASGMKVLSENGVIHRDLKPHNIMVTYQVPRRVRTAIVLKIGDFGLARFLEEGEKAETGCGSLTYMAPEVRNLKAYNAKADMWSLGIIVFQCLNGITQNNQIPAGTSVELEELLLGLLQKDPANRFDLKTLTNHNFLTSSTRHYRSPEHQVQKQISMVGEANRPTRQLGQKQNKGPNPWLVAGAAVLAVGGVIAAASAIFSATSTSNRNDSDSD